jgi:hypothetical protein
MPGIEWVAAKTKDDMPYLWMLIGVLVLASLVTCVAIVA